MKLLDAIDKLRVHTREGRRSPHKPLLLLYALAEQARNPQTRVKFEFSEAEKFLRKLLDEFWNPSSRGSYRVHYPFWRLREDNEIWEVYPYRKIIEDLTDSNERPLRCKDFWVPVSLTRAGQARHQPYFAHPTAMLPDSYRTRH